MAAETNLVILYVLLLLLSPSLTVVWQAFSILTGQLDSNLHIFLAPFDLLMWA